MTDTPDSPAESRLRAARLRLTPARRQVLTVLLSAEQALTHTQVAERLQPKLDRVTLYRTLELLAEQGLAHKLIGADRVSRFNAAAEDQTHPHFQCTQCGQLFCLASLTNLPTFNLPPGFSVTQTEITLRGCCATCSHLHNAT